MTTPPSTPALATNRVDAWERKLLKFLPISMESLSNTRKQLSILALYLNQVEARDKICRAIQYSSKFVSGGNEGVAQQVDSSTALARKVFRLLKSINELEALASPSAKSEPLSVVLLSKSKNSLMATFLLLDHLVWAGRIGIYKNKRHTDLVSNISLYFLLGGYACSSLAELLHLVWTKKDEAAKQEEKEQYPYAAHLLGLVRSSLDVVVAAGLLQLAPKSVTPRITGACGTVSSLIACYELFRAASSSKQERIKTE